MRNLFFLLFLITSTFTFAQNVDLSSVDEFFKITDKLKNGEEIKLSLNGTLQNQIAIVLLNLEKANELITKETASAIEQVYGDVNKYLDSLVEQVVNKLKK